MPNSQKTPASRRSSMDETQTTASRRSNMGETKTATSRRSSMSDFVRRFSGTRRASNPHQELDYLSARLVLSFFDLAKFHKISNNSKKWLEELAKDNGLDDLESLTSLSENSQASMDSKDAEWSNDLCKYKDIKLTNLGEISNAIKNSGVGDKSLYIFRELINYVPNSAENPDQKVEIAKDFLKSNPVISTLDERGLNSIKLALIKCAKNPLNKVFFKEVIGNFISISKTPNIRDTFFTSKIQDDLDEKEGAKKEKFRNTNLDIANLIKVCISDHELQNKGLYDRGYTGELFDYLSLTLIYSFIDLAQIHNIDSNSKEWLKKWAKDNGCKEKILNDFEQTPLLPIDEEELRALKDNIWEENKSKYKYLELNNLNEIKDAIKNDKNKDKLLYIFRVLINYTPKDETEAGQKVEIARDFLKSNPVVSNRGIEELNGIKLALIKCSSEALNQSFFEVVISNFVSENALFYASMASTTSPVNKITDFEFLLKNFVTTHNLPIQDLFFTFIKTQENNLISAGLEEGGAIKIQKQVVDLINGFLKLENIKQPIIEFEKILEHAISDWSLEGVKYLMNNCISPNIQKLESQETNPNKILFINAAKKLDLIPKDTQNSKDNEGEIIGIIIKKIEDRGVCLISSDEVNLNTLLATRFINGVLIDESLSKDDKEMAFIKILGHITSFDKNDPKYPDLLNLFKKSLAITTGESFGIAFEMLLKAEKFDAIQLLVDESAKNINEMVLKNLTPLHLAINKNSLEAVKILCSSKNLDLETPSLYGTPLEYAFLKYNEKGKEDKKDIDSNPNLSTFYAIVSTIKEKSLNKYLKDKETPINKIDGVDKKEIEVDGVKFMVSTNNAVIHEFEEVISSQENKLVPDKPYRGIGINANIEIANKSIKIDEFYDIKNGRITHDGKKILSNENLSEKYLFAIEVQEEGVKIMKTVSEFLESEAKLAELIKLCHNEGAIKFTLTDNPDGTNPKEYSCKRDKEHVYVTDVCKNLKHEISKKGETYNPDSAFHGIEVLGDKFMNLGIELPEISQPNTSFEAKGASTIGVLGNLKFTKF